MESTRALENGAHELLSSKGQTLLRQMMWCHVGVLVALALNLPTQLAAGAEMKPEASIHRQPYDVNVLSRIKEIGTLALSPDGRHAVTVVREPDPIANEYRLIWNITDTATGTTRRGTSSLGARPAGGPGEAPGGELEIPTVKWASNSASFLFLRRNEDHVELWRMTLPRLTAKRLSDPSIDIRGFCWRPHEQILFWGVSIRDPGQTQSHLSRLNGFNVDSVVALTDLVDVREVVLSEHIGSWALDATSHVPVRMRDANAKSITSHCDEGVPAPSPAFAPVTVAPNIVAPMGRIQVEDRGHKTLCMDERCYFQFLGGAWFVNADHRVVAFWRKEGVNARNSDGIYLWNTSTDVVESVYISNQDTFRDCQFSHSTLVCIRQTRTQPDHLVRIDLINKQVVSLFDANPGLAKYETPHMEYIEWDLPDAAADLGYPKRAFGYIIYPINFDPAKRYPVVVAPYFATGFAKGDAGDEQPLFAYAAAGFVVLNTEFPMPYGGYASYDNATLLRHMYSAEAGFPHLTMLAASTFRAMDLLIGRGFVDPSRIGIGGVSHGSFVPMFMMQQQDRFAAASISSPRWSQDQRYILSRAERARRAATGLPLDLPESIAYWRNIDPADHASAIEAPILFQYADREFVTEYRLLRMLDDAQRPYDAYIFDDEYHYKWQPAHRLAVYRRNLDWFRFWLQGYEDPTPAKVDQYLRWEDLCSLQVANYPDRPEFCVPPKAH